MIKIEHQKSYSRPSFGGTTLCVDYTMSHIVNDRINIYEIECTIEGVQSGDVHLSANSAKALFSNDETLTESAACDLFEDNI